MFDEIKSSLKELYLSDNRPWLVGFSGGKDSTMVADLIFSLVLSFPTKERNKPISILCHGYPSRDSRDCRDDRVDFRADAGGFFSIKIT